MELNPYANYLNGQDPIPVLTATADQHSHPHRHLRGPDRPRPTPRKWSIREITAHLADCESRLLLPPSSNPAPRHQPHAIIQPFDQDAWAKRYQAYPFESALALFQAARNWNLLFLATVSAQDRRRPTTHPERGTMPFWTIVETMGGHDINHLQQIERLAAPPP